jgi:hypothetical protein
MISKNNRQNSNFQILHFLVGSCHTVDAAYSLLCDLKEDREMALATVKTADLRSRAKISKANTIINDSNSKEYEILEAQADLEELNSSKEVSQRNIDAAQDELNFIIDCMSKLEPHRKFAHLSLPESHQAMQQEEWKLELVHRAENYLLTTGSIPPEHFETMRQHPEFKTELVPQIEQIRIKVSQGLSLSKISLKTSSVMQTLGYEK